MAHASMALDKPVMMMVMRLSTPVLAGTTRGASTLAGQWGSCGTSWVDEALTPPGAEASWSAMGKIHRPTYQTQQHPAPAPWPAVTARSAALNPT